MNNNPPTFRSILPLSILLVAIGLLGLFILMQTSLPTIFPRWVFYFFIVLAATGLAIPVALFLNIRFPSKPPVGMNIILRESIWAGIYAGLIAWLQLGRVLTSFLTVVLAIVIILVEVLLRMWERSRWEPPQA
jgi:low temperature requirement protein LtrA